MKDKCFNCGGKNFVIGVQGSYAEVYPAGKIFTLKSQKLYHVICKDCGTVVRSFVKEPEMLVNDKKIPNDL